MENKARRNLHLAKRIISYLIASAAIVILDIFYVWWWKLDNPNEFHYDEIFSPIRITVASILVLVALGLAKFMQL